MSQTVVNVAVGSRFDTALVTESRGRSSAGHPSEGGCSVAAALDALDQVERSAGTASVCQACDCPRETHGQHERPIEARAVPAYSAVMMIHATAIAPGTLRSNNVAPTKTVADSGTSSRQSDHQPFWPTTVSVPRQAPPDYVFVCTVYIGNLKPMTGKPADHNMATSRAILRTFRNRTEPFMVISLSTDSPDRTDRLASIVAQSVPLGFLHQARFRTDADTIKFGCTSGSVIGRETSGHVRR